MTAAKSFDLKSLLTSGARILWAGAMPPLAHFDVDARILDPAFDYRMPADSHQSYDLVYLVERDLGRQKAWPLIMDEALRLLAPGGVLVVRMTNTSMCSIFALKHFVHQWGGMEPVFEFTCDDGATEFAMRNTRTSRRPANSVSVSFGVITDGNRQERLFAFLDSVYALEDVPGQEVELLVCGPVHIAEELASAYPSVQFVADTGEFAAQGWITRKKNQIVDRARGETLVIAHDRYTIDRSFLRALAGFGGDFGLMVCRQVRPDGRRFPDWVSLGAQWSWSSPAMLEYGDWSPHVYINGGITIGKTEILRRVRWNEFLFWNQAEDVELTRRLSNLGHIPRLARTVVATSHVMRAGTMEAFEPLSAVADRYHISGPANATGEIVTPSLPLTQFIRLGKRAGEMPARMGVFRCEQWYVAQDAIELPAGVFGEIGGRLASTPTTPIELTLSLAAPCGRVEVMVNDAVCPTESVDLRTVRVRIPTACFAGTRVCRLHLRSERGTLQLRGLEFTPEGWHVGMPLPVTHEGVMALAGRYNAALPLDGSALCLGDLPLLMRGAQRIAVFVPSALAGAIAAAAVVSALREHARHDAVIRIVGESGTHELFDGCPPFAVDWQRYGSDRQYLIDCNGAFNAFKPELVVNLHSPRSLLADVMVVESQPLGAIGFDAADYELKDGAQDYMRPKYTRLVVASSPTSMQDALGIPQVPARLWPDAASRDFAARTLAPLRAEGRGVLLLLGDDAKSLQQAALVNQLQACIADGWTILAFGRPDSAEQLQRTMNRLPSFAYNLGGALPNGAILALLQSCDGYLGGTEQARALAHIAGCAMHASGTPPQSMDAVTALPFELHVGTGAAVV